MSVFENMEWDVKKIAGDIEDVCYEVEKNIVGHTESEARGWAKANALRHARTIIAIQNYCNAQQTDSLSIGNMSGIGWGHQEFSIIAYLRRVIKNVDWNVFDTQDNPSLTKPEFAKMMGRYPEIKMCYTDFKDDHIRFDGEYDVVLFTEIAEHLDYSVLLKLLGLIRSVLKPGGILILTTPNLLSFWNRRCLMFGNGSFPFWGDGTANLESGFFGHIMLYDLSRMCRILRDIGFEPLTAETFTYVYSRYRGLMHGIKSMIHDWLCRHGVGIGTNLFVTATPSPKQHKIPFAL